MNLLTYETIPPTNNSTPKASKQLSKAAYQAKHRQRVIDNLRQLGVSPYGLLRSEGRYLPTVIHEDEPIGGVVYGRHKDGFAMLIATDRRVIFLDKKPFFVTEDEVDYHAVSGVKNNRVGFGSTVTLHTRVKDYAIRTFNEKCARQFVEYIEARSLEHPES